MNSDSKNNLVNRPVVKCHGSGNDFVLIDEFDHELAISEEQRRSLVISLCDRKGVVGADGVLFFSKSKIADAKTRILNADGSEPEICGNGTRCLARYAYERFGKLRMELETIRSVYSVWKEKDIYETIPTFSVQIDTVYFDTAGIPINVKDKRVLENDVIPGFYEDMRFYGLSLTNPHLIRIVKAIDIKELEQVGESANSNKEVFPSGINVSFCRILKEKVIQVETYERGVGLTYSCGTAMSASTLVYCLLHQEYFGKYVDVLNDGGIVKCRADTTGDKYSINLLGNATFVFRGKIDFDFGSPGSLKISEIETNTGEIESYDKLLKYSVNALAEYGIEVKAKKMDPHFSQS